MKKFFNITFIVILMFIGLTGCGDNNNSTNTKDVNNNQNNNYSNKNSYGLGDQFSFSDLELTFDKNYSIVTDTQNNTEIIKLGVTVKNNSSKANFLNMFYYTMYDFNNQDVGISNSKLEDSIVYSKELNPNDSYKKYFYLKYNGDGKYSIIFDDFLSEKVFEFNVSK